MSFLDVLKSHSDTCCIMLYGSVTDCIISRDLCFREFSVALHDILSECGYQNIVFYDFTRASGKYVYDDQSAYYSIAGAKEAYNNKYGKIPGVASPQVSGTNQPSFGAGGRRFGKQRKIVGTAPQDDSQQAQTQPQKDITIPHQQRNLDPALFYGEMSARMTDSSIRTAFVFDLVAFLRDSCSLQNVHNILYQWRNSRNIIIFVNSDGKSISKDDTVLHLLKNAGLYKFFCAENSNGNPVYRPDRCFPILSIQRDEVRYLLHRLMIFHGVEIPEGIDDTSDKINYILHAKSEADTITLRRLYELSESFLSSGGHVIDDKFCETVCGVNINDYDFHPLMTLHDRPGWSSAVEQLTDELIMLCQDNSGDICGASGIAEKISWLSDRNRNKHCDSEETLAVFRLGGSYSAGTYPDSSKLPHMMLIGRPGTGKTTAAMLLGRVFHDAGLLESGHVVHIDAGSLQAGYVGQTPMRVNEWLDKSENGVLFVDEAYMLCKDFGRDGNSGTFAEEALDTLINAMTDTSRHVLIIFSGYPSDNPEDFEDIGSVRGLYKMNPGLRRRIKLEIEIDDYDPETMTEIFMKSIKRSGYMLGDDLNRDDVLCFMKYHYQTRTRDFANGGFAERIAAVCVAGAKKRGSQSALSRKDFGDGEKYLDPITMDSVYEELKSYPGLSNVGMRIINDSVNLFKNRQKVGIKTPDSPKNIILLGKRGTGKNTLAKILCKAWGISGIMSGKPPVVITNPSACRSDVLHKEIMRSIYEHTALFIDEAHNAPQEFIRELLNPMTEYGNLTCIFAVYPERLDAFFSKDPGLRDRCMKPYEIPDYTPEQLADIFVAIAERQRRIVDDSCMKVMRAWFELKYSSRDGDKDYSNARMVKNLVEEMETATDSTIFSESDIPQEILQEITQKLNI